MCECSKQLILFLFLMLLFGFSLPAVAQPVKLVFACFVVAAAAVQSETKESRV